MQTDKCKQSILFILVHIMTISVNVIQYIRHIFVDCTLSVCVKGDTQRLTGSSHSSPNTSSAYWNIASVFHVWHCGCLLMSRIPTYTLAHNLILPPASVI